MTHTKRTAIEGAIAFALALVLLFMLVNDANGQEEPHPAFGAAHKLSLIGEIEVDDIPKIEAKAIDILRTKLGKTLDEARAMVRVDDKTDVARCIEFVTINAVMGVVQYRAVNVTVANEHPVQEPPQE